MSEPRDRALDLLAPHDRAVPPAYVVAGVTAGLVVALSYLSADWMPWIVRDTPPAASRLALVIVGPGAALLMPLVVALALRWPGFAVAVACVPVVVGLIDPQQSIHFGVFATLGSIVLVTSWRRPRASVLVTALALGLVLVWTLSGAVMSAPFGAEIDLRYGAGRVGTSITYATAFALLLAFSLRLRTTVLREQQRRGLLAREEQVGAQQAVVAERARLARDLHDVVAHHVSLIAVRAETAPYTEPGLDPAGRAVLAEVASEARLALDELRGVLGILGRSDDAARSPQPGLGDVVALVERAARSGQDVAVTGDVQAPVGAAAGYAAYRVVQEALTNARRHAPGARVEVTVTATERLLEVVVANAAPDGASIGGGRGLVGMRERVEALGGWLVVDAAGARFVVRATLPAAGAQA